MPRRREGPRRWRSFGEPRPRGSGASRPSAPRRQSTVRSSPPPAGPRALAPGEPGGQPRPRSPAGRREGRPRTPACGAPRGPGARSPRAAPLEALLEIRQHDANGVRRHPRAPGRGRDHPARRGTGGRLAKPRAPSASARSARGPVPVARRTSTWRSSCPEPAGSRAGSRGRASRSTRATPRSARAAPRRPAPGCTWSSSTPTPSSPRCSRPGSTSCSTFARPRSGGARASGRSGP